MHAISSISKHSSATPDRIRNVAKEFESLFTSMMLRSMRKTVGENPLIPQSFGEKVYTEMLDDEYAKMLGNEVSLGLADLIVKELERQGTATTSLHNLKELQNKQTWMYDSKRLPQRNTSQATRVSVYDRVKKWDPLISEAAEKYGVDKNLISAVIAQESAGNPYAVSRAGAKGLMQLMDSTARDLGVSQPFSPEANIHGGVRYLRQMLDTWNGDERLALASYNAGPGAVARYKGIPPYAETIDYVKSVLSYRESLQQKD